MNNADEMKRTLMDKAAEINRQLYCLKTQLERLQVTLTLPSLKGEQVGKKSVTVCLDEHLEESLRALNNLNSTVLHLLRVVGPHKDPAQNVESELA